MIEESDAAGNMQEAYVFFGGKRIANRVVSSGAISYYAEDFIGSSRVITTSLGATCYDADFYPYGSESNVTNTCPQNYKWTGKERDAETGNDDFDARYYSSVYGRFLSADWSAVPAAVPYANLTNPQTLNLYAIVRDNPESFADLDGHAATLTGSSCVDNGSGGVGCGSIVNAEAQDQKKVEQQNAQQVQQKTQEQCAKYGCGTGTPKSEHPDPTNPHLPDVKVGASATIATLNVNSDGKISAVLDAPSLGASIDVTINGSNKTDTVLGSVGVGAGKHAGVDTDIVKDANGAISAKGLTVHVGVSTPTLPVHAATAPSKMSEEFKWVLRSNSSSRDPLQ